jgi:MGT family glycosyltransferase
MTVLARELMKRGHRVTFMGFPDMRAKLAEELSFIAFGEADWPLDSLQPYVARLARLGGPLSLRRLITDLAGFTDTICRELPSVLDRVRPDFLIIDQADAASSLVATALSVPFVNVANALPLNIEQGVPPPVLPWQYDPSPKGVRRNMGGYRVARLVERPITNVVRRHAERLGRKDIRFADEAWSELGQITQCVQGLDFPRQQLPRRFHYVGPIRSADSPLDLHLPNDGRPLVFCSLGTLQGSRLSIFQAVASALARLNVNLIIAHGGMLGEREVARLNGRAIVRSFVPQRALLAQCDLAITHCGFNTVLDALSFGVPMVGMPLTFEQPATGARLQRVGAAEVIHRWRSPARIRKAVERVLGEPTYRDSAARLSAEIAAAGGVLRAVEIIEQCAGCVVPAAGATMGHAEPSDARDDSRSGNS